MTSPMMNMPPYGGGAEPAPSNIPPVLAGPAQGAMGPMGAEGPMQAFEGMIGTLAAVENELMGVAEQFPGVAPLLRQAVNSIRQAAAQIVGTAQTGSSQPFLPIRG